MIHPWGKKLFYLLLLFFGPTPLFADTSSENWTWTVGCPSDGTTATSTFSASAKRGRRFRRKRQLRPHLDSLHPIYLYPDSGATLNSSTLYGIHTGDWLVIPPVVNTETFPVYTVSAVCPASAVTLNWIFIQWDTNTRTMANTYVLGTATYAPGGNINVTGQYDVVESHFLGNVPMSGSCSNGTYASSGITTDMDGTVFFTADGSGVFKTTAGHATFSFRSTR